MSTVEYPHIIVGGGDPPMLAGTSLKVVEIALDHIAHGWDAQEIQRQHPHLSLGQIHSCLAYYYDHQAELDAEIERQLQSSERIRIAIGPSPLRSRLVEPGDHP